MQQRLLDYKLLVSEQMLSQGLSNVGDSRRMERFLEKLLRGAQRTGSMHLCSEDNSALQQTSIQKSAVIVNHVGSSVAPPNSCQNCQVCGRYFQRPWRSQEEGHASSHHAFVLIHALFFPKNT